MAVFPQLVLWTVSLPVSEAQVTPMKRPRTVSRNFCQIIALGLTTATAALAVDIPVQPTGEYAQIDVTASNQAIKVLLQGNPQEKAAMIKRVTGAADEFAPPVFYVLSAVLFQDGHKDDAMFWFYAGQLRGRFDATICADKSAGSAIDVLNGQFGPSINEYAFTDRQKLKAVVRRVIAWDEKTPYHYDHRWINLHGMGAFGVGPGGGLSVDPKSWPDLARANREKYWSNFRLVVGDNPEDYFTDAKALGLARAAIAGDLAGIDQAIAAGANLNAVGKDGATPLWFAFLAGNKAGFAHLIRAGADPTKRFATMQSSVLELCLRGNDNANLELMLNAKLDPNMVLPGAKQPIIFETLVSRDDSKLKLLIAHGVDVNSRTSRGDTPIIFAARARQFGEVLLLLKNGADPALRAKDGTDIAAGLFHQPNLTKDADQARLQVIAKLAERGYKFDDDAIASTSRIQNLDEATGKSPPKWLKGAKEPNPEWVKTHPVEAEEWYQQYRHQPAPKY